MSDPTAPATECGRCRFADPVIVEDDGPRLLCRRYPPRGDGEWSDWPAVCADDWCGEFRPPEGADNGSEATA